MYTHNRCLLAAALLGGTLTSSILAQTSAFTYQGRLNLAGNPANGFYDLHFAVYDSATAGFQQGPALTNLATPVSNGLFTVPLDFGPAIFTGADRWLEIAVRTNSAGAFTTLNNRQSLTPVPYALYAPNAGTAATVAPNAISSAALQTGAVDSTKIADGSITAADLSSPVLLNTFWRLGGNAGTAPGTTFLGTSDGQPLQIQAGNVGINTAGPDRPLTIQGAGANSEWLSLKDTKGGTRWHLNNSNGGLNFAQTFVSDARLFLANNGAVGIGTLAPGARMEIVDAGQMLLQLSGSHAGGTWFNLANSSLGGHSWGFIGTGTANGEGSGKLLLRDHNVGAVRMTWDLNGFVGVGLSSPLHMVHVGATAGALAINTARTKMAVEDASANGRAVLLALAGPGGTIASNRVELQLEASDGEHRAIIGTTSNHELQFRMNNSAVMTFSTQGNVGIGTSSPTDALLDVEGDIHINDHELWLRGGSDHAHGLGWYGAGKPFAGLTLEGPVLYGWSGGALGSTANGQNVALRWDQSGNVAVKVLEVTGGSDLAEPFPMSDDDISSGTLVVIDDERPGQLKLSREPYDTRVAGIVSGANGVHPGLTLRQDGLLADGKNVALSGRVYALADASENPIRPGDLLTSSTSPGRVMKVTDHSRAQGAVVGKAMSALPQGLGLVLVLVTLQ